MEFSERVLALTQDWLLPKVVDNVLNSNVLALRLIGNSKQGKGEQIKKAIKYQNSSTATSFSGLDTFAASQLETKVRMAYDMRAVRQPIAIAGMEASANAQMPTQVTDLVKEALEETQMELIDYVGDMMYGNGTGNSNKDLIGIGAIVDDATDVASIGGLLRSSYSVLNATRTASGGALTLAKLASLDSAVSSGAGANSATLIVSDKTVWDLYESLLTPMVRHQYSDIGTYRVGRTGGGVRGEALKGTQGFSALNYRGIPWVKDEKATAQTVFLLNENDTFLQFYGWDAASVTGYKKVSMGSPDTIDGVYDDEPMSSFTGFNWSGFNTPTNQFGVIADVILLGNLMSWGPRRHGRLTGVTGV